MAENSLPDFGARGDQVDRVLGTNPEGGRTAYAGVGVRCTSAGQLFPGGATMASSDHKLEE